MEKNSIGIVKKEILELKLPGEDFTFEKGGKLPELKVAFERYGNISEKYDNVIMICHAFSGDSHAAGYYSAKEKTPGWWDIMIGPNKGIDTNKYHVICSNILGGCQGTTGPSSINPETGNPYATDFPEITIGDMVRVQKLLLEELKIKKLFGIIGSSAGGLQVIEWCARFPDSVVNAVCIAAAEHLSAQALSFDIIARNIIMADPYWNNGHYYDNDKPGKGLSLARMIGHITYLSKESMDLKFGRERHNNLKKSLFNTDFQIESYLNHQGNSFVDRFDANSFLYITSAMDSFSLAEGRGSLENAFRQSKSRFMVISVSSDWLYHAEQSKELAENLLRSGKKVTYCNLTSPYGHDSFLLKNPELSNLISSFFSGSKSIEKNSFIADTETLKDYMIISQMIEPETSLLDLGCGDGSFLRKIIFNKQISGHGIDINFNNIIECNKKGVPAYQVNLDEGLGMIPDNFYNYAVLSRTLLEVHKPHLVLHEMVRVARMGIVSFTNFANWKHRIKLCLKGITPVSRELPFNWYDTPNLHFLSLKDFKSFCFESNINIIELFSIPQGIISKILIKLGFENLGTDRVIVKITKRET